MEGDKKDTEMPDNEDDDFDDDEDMDDIGELSQGTMLPPTSGPSFKAPISSGNKG
jgi:hypothetical protein